MQDPQRGPLQQMAGTGAPSAPRPGSGSGNVPYAKGMISGQFGPPPSRSAPPSAPPSGPAPPPRPGGPPPPSGGAPPPMGPPPPDLTQASPFLDPAFLFTQVYPALMQALLDAANSSGPLMGGRY